METKVEIQGELVREFRYELVKEVQLADMLANLERKPPIDIPVLPQNHVASIRLDESKPPTRTLSIAVEIPPAIRLLPLNPNYIVNGIEPRLACPWTIFIFQATTTDQRPDTTAWQLTSTRIYFSRERINGRGGRLIPALLPNVYSNAELCWGDTGDADVHDRLDRRIDALVNSFYGSEFNHGNMDAPWPYRRDSYRRWARETAQLGRTAYRGWTDWTDDDRPHWTVDEAMGIQGDRRAPIVLADGIPDLRVNPTFGLIETAWLPLLNGNQLIRLEASLAALRAEHPERFVALDKPPVDTELDEDDEPTLEIGDNENDDENDEEDDD